MMLLVKSNILHEYVKISQGSVAGSLLNLSRISSWQSAPYFVFRLMSALKINMNKCPLNFRQLLDLLLQRFADGVRLS